MDSVVFPDGRRLRNPVAAGWLCAESVQLIPRPTPLPTGMRGWLETFANPLCAALPSRGNRGGFLDEVAALLKPVLCDADGRWTADYTRLRFAAIKP